MPRIVRRARRLFKERHGRFSVEYSSLVLLVAIAAVALLGHVSVVPD